MEDNQSIIKSGFEEILGEITKGLSQNINGTLTRLTTQLGKFLSELNTIGLGKTYLTRKKNLSGVYEDTCQNYGC